MSAQSYVVVYLAGNQSSSGERAGVVALEGTYDRVEVRHREHLNYHTSPVCDAVWSLDPATIPEAAANLPRAEV